MTLVLRGKLWSYDFWRGGERYWGSTETRNKAEAKAKQALAIKKAEAEIRLRDEAIARAEAPRDQHNPTVAWMADSLSDLRRETRRDKHFFNNLKHMVQTLGPGRRVDHMTDQDVSRALLSERIRWLLFGQRRLKHPGDVERYLPADLLGSDGSRLSNARLSEIMDILVERMAEAPDPRYPLGIGAVRIDILGAINGILIHARDVHGIALKKLETLSMKGLPSYARTRLLTVEEELQLRAHLDPYLVLIVTFALLSLFRISNMVQLRWSEVDLPHRRIKIVVKGGKSFTRKIGDRMAAILVALPRRGEYVFMRPDPMDGDKFVQLTDDWLRGRFLVGCDAASIRDMHFHDLRRTGATRLYYAKNNIRVVQRALGHSKVDTTWIYIGETPGDDEESDLLREIHDDAAEAFATNPHAPPLAARDRLLCINVAVALAGVPRDTLRRLVLAAPELAAPLEALARYRSEASAPLIQGSAQVEETMALEYLPQEPGP